ncbi:dnaJ homolog subfamily C member 17-like [Carica papaya]|uniref:dnaJ homolog subfamily C member 17-like n=1 Tax=Carica papaya TaxID=3649 RepID=UPI000B8C7F1C|nr:dnaJ homolog subfamily C member 17-like [Carica papaya]
MDNFVNHYSVLGLPSGDEGAKLSEKEISKAYKLKALELHPDKRPDDPNAQANFQNLKTSYEVLKDENARKLFDEFLKAKQEKIRQQSVQGTKRQKMMVDLEKREQAACAPDLDAQARKEEERIAKKLRGEINSVRERHRPRAATTKSEAEGVVAATKTVCGDLSNPLLVVPLQREAAMEFPTAEKSAETENLSNLVGAGYQAFEDSVLEKLQKAARSQK